MDLEHEHAHVRDQRIFFDEEPHIYYIDGSSENYLSATTIIHSFFHEFDAKRMSILTHKKHSKNVDSKYYGMTPEEIQLMWTDNSAAELGTKMHKDIELYFNNQLVQNDSDEYSYFKNFVKDHPELTSNPYRTEWVVFDEDVKIAGSIDMTFKNPDGSLTIYDWKRSKKITTDNRFQSGKAPFEHLADCNYNHYCLQLNLYKRILEKKYNQKIKQMFLLILHPTNEEYIKIKIPNLADDINVLYEHRKNDLKNAGIEE